MRQVYVWAIAGLLTACGGGEVNCEITEIRSQVFTAQETYWERCRTEICDDRRVIYRRCHRD